MIKKISIHGLKSIKSLVIDFKPNNSIKGRNGIGKTAIKDAISFVLYGKISNTDRIDDAINKESDRIKVSAIFTIKEKDYIVERSRTTKGSKPSINGKEVEQSDINALFGDHDEFICSNFVGEFMKFSESERRELLLNKFKPVDREKLFKDLTGEDPSLVNLDNLDETEKKLKKQHKELEAERNLLSSQKELISNDILKMKEELNSLEEVEDVSAEIARIKKSIDEENTNDLDYLKFMPAPVDTSDIDKKIKAIEEASFLFQRNLPSAAKLDSLKNQITEKKSEIERLLSSSVCPTCKRAFDNADDNKIKAKEVETEVISLYKEYKNEESLLSEANDKYKKELDKLSVDRSKLIAEKESIINKYDTDCIEAKKKYEEASKVKVDKIKELSMYLESLSTQDSKRASYIAKKNLLLETLQTNQEKVDNISKQIFSKNGVALENMLKAFGPKGIKFHEILSQQEAVNKLLPKGISIEFMKENKTNDGFKPCFQVVQDGIDYNWLSTGMKLGVDMSLLSLFNRSFMAVIDNYESFTGKLSDNLKNKQIITLSAEDCDLTIN